MTAFMQPAGIDKQPFDRVLGLEAFTLSLAAGAALIVLAGYLARTDS